MTLASKKCTLRAFDQAMSTIVMVAKRLGSKEIAQLAHLENEIVSFCA